MNPNPPSLPPALNDELLDLLGQVCNCVATDDQRQRLHEILADNPAAQHQYVQYMALHAELHWLESSLTAGHGISADSLGLTNSSGSRNSSWITWIASLAALLLVAIGIGLFSVSSKTQLAGNSQNNLADQPIVAKVTGSLNCRWQMPAQEQSAGLGYGSQLRAGQRLDLVEGIAEITFEQGARMILEAPVKLDVAEAASVLHQGRLTATCPPGAEGFQINTPEVVLIDRGTEFGVWADGLGNLEVHVFEGLVDGLYRPSVDGPLTTVQWRTSESVRYDKVHRTMTSVERADADFVRTLSSSLGPARGLLAGEDFDYPVGRLGGQNGGFGWGGPWVDVSVANDDPETNAVAPGSLRYGVLVGSRNHAVLNGTFNRIRRLMSTSYSGVFDTAGLVEDQDGARVIGRDGTTLYLSFVQQVDQLDQVFYGLELHRGDGNRNRVLCIGHGAARSWVETGKSREPDLAAGVTGWAVTSELNGAGQSLLELGDLGPETDTVSLFVLKIEFGDDDLDQITVYKNPASLWDEQQCVPSVTGAGNFSFDRIGLANFEGEKSFKMDHIRIGTSFSSVTHPSWHTSDNIEADLK